MNTIHLPDDKDWVDNYGRARLARLLRSKLHRPIVYLILGAIVGGIVALCWAFS